MGEGHTPPPGLDPGVLMSYSPFALWSPHFETDLEIVQNHLDAGGKAVLLSCEGQLNTCEPNPEHRLLACLACRSRFKSGLKWLRGPGLSTSTFYALTREEELVVQELREREWSSLDQLRAFHMDGVDIGMAALSSVVSETRESHPDVRLFKETIGKHVSTAAMVYFSIKRQLSTREVHALSIFNGRLSSLRPALRLARSAGIIAYVHDRAGRNERYCLTVDSYPHDLSVIKDDIEKSFPARPLTAEEQRAALGWYEERRTGMAQNWHSFTAAQRVGALPSEMSLEQVNVAIFLSSEDEYVAVEEWQNPFYADQNEALERLLSDLPPDSRLRFFLRIHPNLAGLANTQMDGVHRLSARFPNLVVIAADSAISSYALMDAVHLVLSYGSTAGIEACFAGKTSVLMGRAMYEDLDVCIRPASHEELLRLLSDVSLGKEVARPAGHELGLLKYGHYQTASGRKFNYVVPSGLFSARMKRDNRVETLQSGFLVRFAYRLQRYLLGLTAQLSNRSRSTGTIERPPGPGSAA